MIKSYAKEFPLLQPLGLYATQTSGDGNCLFNALSDQLYGTEEHHAKLRQNTIGHIIAHKDFYQNYVDVNPTNATRRQPKRKTAGAYATKFDASMPDADQIDRAFDSYIQNMARGGTWGGNMELVAFAAVYQVNIFIYQRTLRYQVNAPNSTDVKGDVHIAYHEWQHYSSIRNIQGPHSGLPEVQVSTESSAMPKPNSTTGPTNAISMTFNDSEIKMVQNSVNPPVTREVAQQALENHHGDINYAVDYLISAHDNPSTSSSQTASIVDSSDGSYGQQKKKQNRRISRATKNFNREKKRQEISMKLERASSDSLESLIRVSPSDALARNITTLEDSDDDFMPPPLKDGDTSSSSEYSATPAPLSRPKIILKMNKTNEGISRSPPKPTTNTKRLVSARERKDLKKQQQKLEAKERKKAAAIKNAQSSSHPSSGQSSQYEATLMTKSSSHPGMTSGIQTLQI